MERPPKRLKGWKFEHAKATPCSKEAVPDDPSPLCSRLLELWALGKLSAVQITEIAHLAMLEGCKHGEILALAKAGSFGGYKGNAHRDLITTFCKGIHICDPFPVAVDVLDANTRKVIKAEASLFLPHMLFSSLYESYPLVFEELFCFKDAEAFWKNLEKLQDPRLVPPLTLDKRVVNPSKTCPIFIHGDGAEYQTRDSLLTWSWGAMLSKKESLASHLLLAAVPKCCTTATTWDPLHDYIAWSFAALMKGKHPSTDPYGGELPEALAAKAGLPLTAGNHRACIYSIQGDQEFMSNVLGLPHWQNKFPCAHCDCQRPVYKGIACPEGKSVKLLREEDQRYVDFTHQQSLLDKRSSHPLFSLPGISTAMVLGDSLHILYSRGVASHLAGSLLHFLCYFDGVKKRQKVAPSQRLQTIFAKIKELYVARQVGSRLTNLRLSMICADAARPHQGFACLEAKAAETKHLLPCLFQVLKEALPAGEPIHQTMLDCLEALINIADHYDAIGIFPTPTEYQQACNLAKRFFSTYHDLNQWALLKGRKLFHITFKFHAFRHLILTSKFLNFRIHANYRAEHFVGRMSVLTHSTSFGVKSSKLSSKLAVKYRFLLHLQLTRPDFGLVEEDLNDP